MHHHVGLDVGYRGPNSVPRACVAWGLPSKSSPEPLKSKVKMVQKSKILLCSWGERVRIPRAVSRTSRAARSPDFVQDSGKLEDLCTLEETPADEAPLHFGSNSTFLRCGF